MRTQDDLDRRPSFTRHGRLHYFRHLCIPLKQLQGDPGTRVRLRDERCSQAFDLLQHLLVVCTHFRRIGKWNTGTIKDMLNLAQQVLDPFGARSGHRNHRYTQRNRQHMGIDPDTLLLGHIHHVQGNHHWRLDGSQF